MYVDFYKLKSPPFQLTPDHRFFFNSSVHVRAKAYLTYGLSQGEGFIVITGDVGAGKTTLVGHLLSGLDPARYVAGKIVTTQLEADDTLRMVASVFDIPHETAEKATILERIEGFLAAHQAEDRRCLLVVDEAQNLTVPALEELRMLSNFQTGGQAQLQSFLLGQPQFRRTLASPDLDQFRQRVIASFHLGPMDADETAEYVKHRLRAVGWNDDPRFADGVFEEIYEKTEGIPRRINLLCSRLLLFGYLEERHDLGREDVRQVAEDLDQEAEQVLDNSAPNPALSAAPAEAIALAAPPSSAMLDVDDKISKLERRLESIEATISRRDRAFRQALLSFSDYLQALSTDLKGKIEP